MTPGRSFVRDNAFLVAAVTLPLVVVAFFLASSAIPRWLVPPPAYDLLITATEGYNPSNPRASIELSARDGRIEATVRPLPANSYGTRARLFLFDHTTLDTREIPVDLPNLDSLKEGDPVQTIPVEALRGRQLLTQGNAPDGYRFENRGRSGSGIVGDIFGMHRYETEASLVNRGRVVRVVLPAPQNSYLSSVNALAWLAPEAGDGQR
jgi:hypothetical protein